MKAKTARRILRKYLLAIIRREHLSPSRQKELKEAIRVTVKAEVEKCQ